MRTALVTGGAGFVGQHLCRYLLDRGGRVVCADSMVRAKMDTIRELERGSGNRFVFMPHDVRSENPLLTVDVDDVYHLASFVGPEFCATYPYQTLDVAYEGTKKMLTVAERSGARFMLVSSSEIYGRALVQPIPETYGGNLDPNGPRGPYAEGKRVAETLTTLARQLADVDTRIVRLFNTYGEGMQPTDGRIIPTFIRQALAGEPLTVHDTDSTRAYAYVGDIVRGIVTVMELGGHDPVNLGHPHEWSSSAVAHAVVDVTESKSTIEFVKPPDSYAGEPEKRSPDLTRARALGWSPEVDLIEGLELTTGLRRVAAA